MARAVRTNIITTLQAALEGITITNGYSFDCRAIYPVMPNEAILDSPSAQPCIFLWPGNEEKSLTEWVDAVQNILEIHLVVSGQTCYNAGEVGAEMVADVEKLLLSGTPWAVETDESDPTIRALVDLVPVATVVAQADISEYQPGGYLQFAARFATVIGDPRLPYIRV